MNDLGAIWRHGRGAPLFWGVGPIAELPTITSKTLGSSVWGLGPAVVVVKLAGPIVTGVLVNNVFSLGGTSGKRGHQIQPDDHQSILRSPQRTGRPLATTPGPCRLVPMSAA
jgi:hypothetical protein